MSEMSEGQEDTPLAAEPDDGSRGQPSPLHRIVQERKAAPAESVEERRAALAARPADRRYWVRLNVSPLGWVALVEQGDGGATSALGDVLDLGGGGCLIVLSNVPGDLLRKGQEVVVALRPGPNQTVTCIGEVLDWTEFPNGVQVRIAFRSSDPEVHRQLTTAAATARVRLLQLDRGDD